MIPCLAYLLKDTGLSWCQPDCLHASHQRLRLSLISILSLRDMSDLSPWYPLLRIFPDCFWEKHPHSLPAASLLHSRQGTKPYHHIIYIQNDYADEFSPYCVPWNSADKIVCQQRTHRGSYSVSHLLSQGGFKLRNYAMNESWKTVSTRQKRRRILLPWS